MAPPTTRQLAARERIESLIRLAAPVLDLVLAAGDRISRGAQRSELDAPVARPLAGDAGRNGHALPRATGPAGQ